MRINLFPLFHASWGRNHYTRRRELHVLFAMWPREEARPGDMWPCLLHLEAYFYDGKPRIWVWCADPADKPVRYQH